MHGAAMAWVVLMPPHAAAVELWPQSSGIWRCYEHLSHWAGLLYRYCAAGSFHKAWFYDMAGPGMPCIASCGPDSMHADPAVMTCLNLNRQSWGYQSVVVTGSVTGTAEWE